MGKELLQGYYNNEETGGISTFSVVTDDGYSNKSICENIEEVGDNIKEKIGKKVNRAHLMVGYSKNRVEGDVYNTPTSAILELLKREKFYSNIIWECACSIGNISKALENHYPDKTIISSDLRDTNDIYGIKSFDFLSDCCFDILPVNKGGSIDIVTNPPYSHTIEFIKQAKKIATHKIAFLLKLNALGGINRYKEVWSDKKFPLKSVYVFCKRLDFGLLSSPTLEYIFAVFCKDHIGLPMIDWITNF